ncbi:hypothetical protein QP866_02440 [Corynebacterium imitans]|uniref:hypothetical protein n=1 Tax=Corynebacterium imitans TaxID=156978 RepID=UPI00254FB60D|nr:hypothetical protein [Corynebacterium imitans]MDK8636685.1 hypothetical protein [Corynebacterium imitans]MDK8772300.1 hypothetical protein [Corynebacterium imitans]
MGGKRARKKLAKQRNNAKIKQTPFPDAGDAEKRLSELPAVEERLFRFRLSGEARLWGFRSGALFRILWYDPEHQVSPVSLRNT